MFDDLDKRQGRDELDEIVVEKYLPVQILERLNFEVVEPLGQDHLQLFKLLFFGNLHQDFTEFVLHDLGISPFENYVMDSSGRYFDDRSLVDGVVQSYITADTCKQVLEEDDEELLAEFSVSNLIDVEVTDPGLQRRYSRLFNTTARQLERFERVEEALPLYEKSVLVPARERRSRIYHKLGDVDRAVQICREIYDDPMDEAEHEFSISFSRRLCKRYQIDCDWLEEPQKDDFSFREIAVEQDEEVNVELLACNWFLEQDIDARYVENGLLPGLFGLFFWDIIFAPVKGAFFNPFQRGPADLYTPEFRKARQDLIDDHLGLVEEKNFLTEVILQTFEEKSGFANHFVKWRWLDQTLITKSLERIPAHHLKLIFERMLRDLRNNRTGFPDLVVFPPDRDYCLSEIKGPGDRLQNNQRRWFRFFRQNEIPAEIINVIWK